MPEAVWIANIRTERDRRYTWVYDTEPSRTQVIETLHLYECEADLEHYWANTDVVIFQTKVRKVNDASR